MNWFTRLCRQTGLIVHDIVKPVGPASGGVSGGRREVGRTVEEKKVSGKITLRRTTIEEIEVKQDRSDDTP